MDDSEQFLFQVGKKLKSYRELNGQKQSDISFHTGLETSEISKYEKGKINMTLKTLYKFAKVLNVNPKELLDIPTSSNH